MRARRGEGVGVGVALLLFSTTSAPLRLAAGAVLAASNVAASRPVPSTVEADQAQAPAETATAAASSSSTTDAREQAPRPTSGGPSQNPAQQDAGEDTTASIRLPEVGTTTASFLVGPGGRMTDRRTNKQGDTLVLEDVDQYQVQELREPVVKARERNTFLTFYGQGDEDQVAEVWNKRRVRSLPPPGRRWRCSHDLQPVEEFVFGGHGVSVDGSGRDTNANAAAGTQKEDDSDGLSLVRRHRRSQTTHFTDREDDSEDGRAAEGDIDNAGDALSATEAAASSTFLPAASATAPPEDVDLDTDEQATAWASPEDFAARDEAEAAAVQPVGQPQLPAPGAHPWLFAASPPWPGASATSELRLPVLPAGADEYYLQQCQLFYEQNGGLQPQPPEGYFASWSRSTTAGSTSPAADHQAAGAAPAVSPACAAYYNYLMNQHNYLNTMLQQQLQEEPQATSSAAQRLALAQAAQQHQLLLLHNAQWYAMAAAAEQQAQELQGQQDDDETTHRLKSGRRSSRCSRTTGGRGSGTKSKEERSGAAGGVEVANYSCWWNSAMGEVASGSCGSSEEQADSAAGASGDDPSLPAEEPDMEEPPEAEGRSQTGSGGGHQQRRLRLARKTPDVVDQAVVVEQYRYLLQGWDTDPRGPTTMFIPALPAHFNQENLAAFLREMLPDAAFNMVYIPFRLDMDRINATGRDPSWNQRGRAHWSWNRNGPAGGCYYPGRDRPLPVPQDIVDWRFPAVDAHRLHRMSPPRRWHAGYAFVNFVSKADFDRALQTLSTTAALSRKLPFEDVAQLPLSRQGKIMYQCPRAAAQQGLRSYLNKHGSRRNPINRDWWKQLQAEENTRYWGRPQYYASEGAKQPMEPAEASQWLAWVEQNTSQLGGRIQSASSSARALQAADQDCINMRAVVQEQRKPPGRARGWRPHY